MRGPKCLMRSDQKRKSAIYRRDTTVGLEYYKHVYKNLNDILHTVFFGTTDILACKESTEYCVLLNHTVLQE